MHSRYKSIFDLSLGDRRFLLSKEFWVLLFLGFLTLVLSFGSFFNLFPFPIALTLLLAGHFIAFAYAKLEIVDEYAVFSQYLLEHLICWAVFQIGPFFCSLVGFYFSFKIPVAHYGTGSLGTILVVILLLGWLLISTFLLILFVVVSNLFRVVDE